MLVIILNYETLKTQTFLKGRSPMKCLTRSIDRQSVGLSRIEDGMFITIVLVK